MSPKTWPLTPRQLQRFYSISHKNNTSYPFSISVNKILFIHESTRAGERKNIHVMEHCGAESSTWLQRARQPQHYIQDKPFHSPHQRNAKAECQTTATTLEMVEGCHKVDCVRLLTKHLSLLVLALSFNTHQLLLLVFFHAHAISLGPSACVGQSVRSEGTWNKTLLCICQAVPALLPS